MISLLAVYGESRESVPSHDVVVESPRRDVRISFSLREIHGATQVPCYSVSYRNADIIRHSSMGMDLAEGGALRSKLKITKITRHKRDEAYRVIVGKTSAARDRHNEAVIALQESSPPHRRIDIALRAYDEGAAFRYILPSQDALPRFTVTDERSTFATVGNPKVYALPLGSFTTSYETRYKTVLAKEIGADSLLALPLLMEFPGKFWAAITEANLTDYPGMYLSGDPGYPGRFVSKLAPWPNYTDIKVKASTPHGSPWRVIMLADDPGKLIESNLIFHLNDPCAIKDTSWIHPGKTTFPWWNGYHLSGVNFRPGLNTATMKHYIDFCAENGIEYHSLDGYDRAWYGGPIVPYEGADITKSVPEIDLTEVLRYSRAKGVRLRLWMHWQAAQAHMKRAFPIYEKWGIEGVMVDFMDRDDQQMVNFLRDVVETAAQHHLTVTFHGVSKPTGLERTYPNLLTSEGVLNLEYNKWDPVGCSPDHQMMIPFTRMLAGPLDFHQGSFRSVSRNEFVPRNEAPVTIGTRCRHLAMYVVYDDPLPMVADYPEVYRNQMGLEFLRQVPTVWDETRVLQAAVGEYITIARRKGRDWYVGSMTDDHPRNLTIPLRFLGRGKYTAETYSDTPLNVNVVVRSRKVVSASQLMEMHLAPAGGFVAHFQRRESVDE